MSSPLSRLHLHNNLTIISHLPTNIGHLSDRVLLLPYSIWIVLGSYLLPLATQIPLVSRHFSQTIPRHLFLLIMLPFVKSTMCLIIPSSKLMFSISVKGLSYWFGNGYYLLFQIPHLGYKYIPYWAPPSHDKNSSAKHHLFDFNQFHYMQPSKTCTACNISRPGVQPLDPFGGIVLKVIKDV